VFGAKVPPKYVPPFSWGEGEALEEFRLAKFLEIAERVMSRRAVALSERSRRQLSASHAKSRSA